MVAGSLQAAKASPHLEALAKRGVELLLLSDRIDEWLMAHVGEYESRQLRDAARGDLDLEGLETPEEKQAAEGAARECEALCVRMQACLGERVAGVRTTQRLADSPACLVRGEHEPGPQLRRLLEAAGQSLPPSRAWLELNPSHALVRRLDALPEGEEFDDLATLLHEQAVLAEGGQLADPASFVRRINRLIGGANAPRIVTPGAD